MGTELDYQMKAYIGEAVYEATNRHVGEGAKGVDRTVNNRMIIGERFVDFLKDYGLKIVRAK